MIHITKKEIPSLKSLGEIAKEIFDLRNRLKAKNIELSTIAELSNQLNYKTSEYNKLRTKIFSDAKNI